MTSSNIWNSFVFATWNLQLYVSMFKACTPNPSSATKRIMICIAAMLLWLGWNEIIGGEQSFAYNKAAIFDSMAFVVHKSRRETSQESLVCLSPTACLDFCADLMRERMTFVVGNMVATLATQKFVRTADWLIEHRKEGKARDSVSLYTYCPVRLNKAFKDLFFPFISPRSWVVVWFGMWHEYLSV